ncbi:hypothetical protein [Brevibacillus sp. H7]|uniref:hypothetical protein n=1 Tax=Brevibacillus sp. H7 TaxID=3349138 RepID=UPI0037F7B95D
METTVTVNQTPPRKSFRKTILTVAAAGIAVLGGLGTAYAQLDLFKSPKMIYLEAEAQGMADLSADVSELVAEYEKQMTPYLEQPVHSTLEISNVKVDATVSPQAQQLLELLNSAKLVVQSDIDQQKQIQYNLIGLHLKDKKLLGMEMFMDQNRVGFGVLDLYKKYGYVDWKDRDVLASKYGMEGLPKRLVTYNDVYSALQASKEELAAVLKDYALLYADSVKDAQVTLKKDVAFSEEGYQTTARELTVTFTSEELNALVTRIAEKAKVDDKLLDLIYTRYQNLAKLMVDSGYPDTEIMSKDVFQSEYRKAFDDILAGLKSSERGKDGMKMVLLINGDDQIISRKMVSTDEQGKEEPGYLHTVKWTNGSESYYRLSFGEIPDQDELKVTYKGKKNGSEKNGTLAIALKTKEESDAELDIKVNSHSKEENSKETGTLEFTVKGNDSATGEQMGLSGSINTSLTKSDKGRETQSRIKLNFDQATPDMPKSISLQLHGKDEFGKAISLPVLTADNSVNLATLSDADMLTLQQELGMAAQQFMMNNMQLFQELGITP